MSKMRIDISSARTRSFSAGGSGGGTVSSPGLTVPRIPYASAAQVLGDTLIRWDNVNGLAALGMTPPSGVQFSVLADAANIGAYTGLATGFATIFCNSTTAVASLGMRFYSESAGGTWLTLAAAKMALISTSGKPSAVVIAGINDVDGVTVPVYIGQKTTGIDTWLVKFDAAIARFAATVQLDTVTASTFIYANASRQIVSLANAAGYLQNNGAGVISWGAVTGFIKDPGGLTDGQVLRYEAGGNARNSPINADSLNGTIGINNNANGSELINGRKDPANVVMWALSGNSYEAFYCHGGNGRGGVHNYRESYPGTLFTLTLADMMFFGSVAGKSSSIVLGSVNDSDAVTIPVYIGQKTTGVDIWLVKFDNAIARFAATVQLDTVTPSTVVYANASRQLVSLANSAGVLTNNGAGALSWAAAAAATNISMTVRNETGAPIVALRCVYATGGFNNFPLIALADNTDVAKHNILGITTAAIPDVTNGSIVYTGVATDLNTNAWNVGTILYLTTGGVLSSTRPTSGEVIPFAQVMVKDVAIGQIYIYKRQAETYLSSAAGQDLDARLGDSAGVQKFKVENYLDTVVASIDSYGNGLFGIGTVPAWLSTQRGRITLFNESGAATLFNMSIGAGVLKAPFIVNNAYNSSGTTWKLTAASATYGKSSKIELNDGTVKLLVSATTGAAAQTITFTTAVDTDTAGNVQVGATLGISQMGDGSNSIVCRRDPCSIFFWPASTYSNIQFRNGDADMRMQWEMNAGVGTIYNISCSKMGFFGNNGSYNGSKMSSLVFGTNNDSDGVFVPVYIGQKSTLQDQWGISLDSGRVSNFQFAYSGGSTEETISRFTKKRGDAAYTNLDKGIIEFCLQGNAGAAAAYVRERWSYAVDTNNIGQWNIDVTTGATPGTSFKSVIQNTTTKIILNNDSWFQEIQLIATVGGAAFIYIKGAGALDISAAINNDIKLDNSGTGRVDFNGPAYVATSITATGYLPIKIQGVAYKMLVST